MKPVIKNTGEQEQLPDLEANFQLRKLRQKQPEPTPTENRFLKALHWMRCPKCGHGLTTRRHGSVDVDSCANCCGLWLSATALEALAASDNELLRSSLREFRSQPE